jgi:hypothetical protein
MGLGEGFILLRALRISCDVRGEDRDARSAPDLAIKGPTKLQGLLMACGQEQMLDCGQT